MAEAFRTWLPAKTVNAPVPKEFTTRRRDVIDEVAELWLQQELESNKISVRSGGRYAFNIKDTRHNEMRRLGNVGGLGSARCWG